MNIKLIIAGALAGLCSAILIDVDAYRQRPSESESFDFSLAIKRWLAGALSGAITAFLAGAPE